MNCRLASVTFLLEVLRSGRVYLDEAGEIQAEYGRYLRPSGQPGVGDRFYREVLNSAPRLITRVDLPKRHDGEYADLPRAVIESGFDPSDRKFAALAQRENLLVINATDSDWLHHRRLLESNGIRIRLLCGAHATRCFDSR